jgi:hypothetical protein
MVLTRRVAFGLVPYDFLSRSFSIPVSGRMSSSGPQKFSDFESYHDRKGGVLAFGGAAHTSGLLASYALTMGMAGWRRQRALFACF